MKTPTLHSCLIAIAAITVIGAAAPADAAPVVVHLNGTYFRENSLALCEWGSSDRSFLNFVIDDGPWTCRAQNKWWDDSCAFSGAPDYRPTDAQYWLHVRDVNNNYVGDLQWPNNNALYEVWYQRCMRVPDGHDWVYSSSITGKPIPGSTCSLTTATRQVVLAEVYGGVVEHIRPAQVRARVMLGAGEMLPPGANDVTLVVQVYAQGSWVDHATLPITTRVAPTIHELWTTLPPSVDVRSQVRGTIRCQEHMGVGYNVREAQIQVEICIPDQSNPGNCL